MDDISYLIIIIILSVFVVFYGGHNNQNKIEYNSDYFNNLNSIVNLEKKISAIYTKNNIFKNNNYVNINNYFNTTNILIQNYVNCFLIKINPNDFFNIFNIIDKSISKYHMMIIFNHNTNNNLELLIDNDHKLNKYIPSIKYFYDLEKNISITGIYHIYNKSNEPIIITCFLLKKPFWYK